MTAIADHYATLCADVQSDIHAHLPAIRAAVEDRNASQVIELGVRNGHSTAALLAGIETNPEGRVWSCDIAWPEVAPAIANHPQWELVVANDLDAVSAAPRSCDVLFIDTSHHYAHTLAELDAYAKRVRPDGCILLHDTELQRPAGAPIDDPDFPVRVAVDEWVAANPGWAVDYTPGCWGLATLTRTPPDV